MPETIQDITADLVRRLGGWLEQPDEASAGLQELRERLDALKGTLGGAATSEALRALSGSEKSIRASRQREAANAIAAAVRELGVNLEAKAPLKRAPRKKAAAKPPAETAPQTPAPVGEGGPSNPPASETPRERSGLLGRLRSAQ